MQRKKPNSIKIYVNGSAFWLYPHQFNLGNARKVHEWLGRLIEWYEQRDKST